MSGYANFLEQCLAAASAEDDDAVSQDIDTVPLCAKDTGGGDHQAEHCDNGDSSAGDCSVDFKPEILEEIKHEPDDVSFHHISIVVK